MLLGVSGYTDGDRLKARFGNPAGLAIDSRDNLYIADQFTYVDLTDDNPISYSMHSVRVLSSAHHNVTTMAGRVGT